MSKSILIIKPSGEVSKEAKDLDSLHQLQRIVDGLVDVVVIAEDKETKRNIDMWINDEGLLNGSEINSVASVLAGRPICGTVAIAASNWEGETIGLEDEDVTKLSLYIDKIPELIEKRLKERLAAYKR